MTAKKELKDLKKGDRLRVTGKARKLDPN